MFYQTGRLQYLLDIPVQPNQYFDSEVLSLSENEKFCDCGAYDGDTRTAMKSQP